MLQGGLQNIGRMMSKIAQPCADIVHRARLPGTTFVAKLLSNQI